MFPQHGGTPSAHLLGPSKRPCLPAMTLHTHWPHLGSKCLGSQSFLDSFSFNPLPWGWQCCSLSLGTPGIGGSQSHFHIPCPLPHQSWALRRMVVVRAEHGCKSQRQGDNSFHVRTQPLFFLLYNIAEKLWNHLIYYISSVSSNLWRDIKTKSIDWISNTRDPRLKAVVAGNSYQSKGKTIWSRLLIVTPLKLSLKMMRNIYSHASASSYSSFSPLQGDCYGNDI